MVYVAKLFPIFYVDINDIYIIFKNLNTRTTVWG